MNSESVCSIFIQSRFGIQSIQSRFRLIKFVDNRKKQVREQVEYEDIGTSIANIPILRIIIDFHFRIKFNM